MSTPPPFSPEEQAAFEAFGNSWVKLHAIEQAIRQGDGPSFSHREALREMQAAAGHLRATVLTHATVLAHTSAPTADLSGDASAAPRP